MKFEDIKNFLYVVTSSYREDESVVGSKAESKLLSEQIHNIKRFEDSYRHYQNILNSYADLAKELKLDNSLKLCMLFTYLLWNGYFSVNKKNIYTNFETAGIGGLAPFDVMNGKGVCLNYSTMLRDFLIVCGYDSANLINMQDINMQYNYMPKVFRSKGRMRRFTKFEEFISKIQVSKTGNHAFTLINEDGELYAYDPTNLALLRIMSINHARVVNGRGDFILLPYVSHGVNTDMKSIATLEKLYLYEKFTLPYTKEYFRETFISLIADLVEKQDLLDEYYNHAFSDIEYVAKTASEEAKKR